MAENNLHATITSEKEVLKAFHALAQANYEAGEDSDFIVVQVKSQEWAMNSLDRIQHLAEFGEHGKFETMEDFDDTFGEETDATPENLQEYAKHLRNMADLVREN